MDNLNLYVIVMTSNLTWYYVLLLLQVESGNSVQPAHYVVRNICTLFEYLFTVSGQTVMTCLKGHLGIKVSHVNKWAVLTWVLKYRQFFEMSNFGPL